MCVEQSISDNPESLDMLRRSSVMYKRECCKGDVFEIKNATKKCLNGITIVKEMEYITWKMDKIDKYFIFF